MTYEEKYCMGRAEYLNVNEGYSLSDGYEIAKKELDLNKKDNEFIKELEKKLPNPPLSKTEKEIALRDFHEGLKIDTIVEHLLYGDFNPEDLL